MKKFLIIALAFIMICAVSACSFADSSSSSSSSSNNVDSSSSYNSSSNGNNSSQEWGGWTDFY